MHTEVCA